MALIGPQRYRVRQEGHARYVAEALTREAFHNVSYFPGSITTVIESLQGGQ